MMVKFFKRYGSAVTSAILFLLLLADTDFNAIPKYRIFTLFLAGIVVILTAIEVITRRGNDGK